jgi:hypothetical protein
MPASRPRPRPSTYNNNSTLNTALQYNAYQSVANDGKDNALDTAMTYRVLTTNSNNSALDAAIKYEVAKDLQEKNKNTQPTHNYNSSSNTLAWYWIFLIIVGGILIIGGLIAGYSYK